MPESFAPPVKRFFWKSVALAYMTLLSPADAKDEFNLRILELDSPLENTATLETFLENNALLPGKYLTTIVWGQDYIDKRTVDFQLSADKQQLIPQFTKSELRDLGVKVDTLPGFRALADSSPVGDINQYLKDAHYDFQLDSQTLYLHIPQIYRDAQAIGYVAPDSWDDGVPALWASYSFSGSRQHTKNNDTHSHWLGLNSGANLGAWRLRNYSTWGDSSGWDSINTVLQRDIKAIRSQLELGETYTNGDLFDSVQMIGVKLESDSNMLPSSLQGFAPVVRGIANSDAKVTIKQNGYTIYQTYVSAGPFEIKDLSQVTASSDLEVTVQEVDGSEHSFIQASSSVPILQREGSLKYSIAGGQYRNSGDGEEPGFGQVTAIYGLPYGVTIFGGVLGASDYRAGLIGTGADMGAFGSLSVDMTAAETVFDDNRHDASGLSWRAQYGKSFSLTGTQMSLASYRYSTSDFYTFQEAIDRRDYANDEGIYGYRQNNNRRSRLQLNVSQTMGALGSLYLNAYQQNYWQLSGYERSVGVGYSASWRGIMWSVNYSMTKTPYSDSDRQVALAINVPLSRWLTNAWATYNMNSAKNGNTTHQAGISGTALEDSNLSYNLLQNYTNHDVGYGGSLSARYRAAVGDFSTGYSYQKENRQWNYSAQGSVVAHADGITLGQSIWDSFAIVHIDDGANVGIQSARGVYTDYWGNAVVPTLMNYRRNTVTVNSQKRDDLDIQDASVEVIPTKGAAVKANYSARSGKRALLTLRRGAGVVPFGAILTLDGASAIVGDNGEVYITGVRGRMPFTVQWGAAADARCAGEIALPEASTAAVYLTTVICR